MLLVPAAASPPWLAVIAVVAICMLLIWYRRAKRDERSPPSVPSPWLPFIGHLIAFTRNGSYYVSMLSSKTHSPVCSFDLLSQRIYVVDDLHLISLLQREEKKKKNREARTLSDRTLHLTVVHQNMFGNSDETMNKMITYDADGMANEPCHRADMGDMLHKTLAPGRVMAQLYLDNMNVVAKEVQEMSMRGPQRVTLLKWLQNVSTISSAAALYGPENPFASSKDLIRTFWEFESGVSILMFNFLPTITAPAALKAREKVVQKLKEFLIWKGETQDGYSELIRNKIRINRRYALSDDGNARSELGMIFAMTASTVPTMFWMIAHILCDQTLQDKILAEIRDAVVMKQMQAHLDIKALKRSCPVLLSTYQETFRTKGAAIATMRVERDFLLDQRYLLNKDALVYIPGHSIHSDPEIWGPDVHEYRPERFMASSPSSSSSSKKQPSPSALRHFGGGAEMCPGRHLAMDLILALTVVVLFTFDMAPGGAQKRFKLPKMDTADAVAIMKPIGDVDVMMNPREGMKGVEWVFD